MPAIDSDAIQRPDETDAILLTKHGGLLTGHPLGTAAEHDAAAVAEGAGRPGAWSRLLVQHGELRLLDPGGL